MNEKNKNTTELLAIERAKQALQLTSASLPHLAGLARLIRLQASERVPVAAVAASGLVLINPSLFAQLSLSDASYVLAHELMHLALDSHGRQGRADQLIANFAHDYIINDILTNELGHEPPLDGLFIEDAREKSFEEWIVSLSQDASRRSNLKCWSAGNHTGALPGTSSAPSRSPLSRALAEAGLTEDEPSESSPFDEDFELGDLIPGDREPDFEPELSPQERLEVSSRVRQVAAKAASLAELKGKIEQAAAESVVEDCERMEAVVDAIRAAYETPWQLALQRWLDAVAPGDRTYARPSRRGADRTDLVLPGRHRHGWTLHIILDTSGSMCDLLPTALGAIAHFCESSGVADIHLIQCDTEVTSDQWLDPLGLASFKVSGFGYSDMRPAMEQLANDPEVTSAMLLTDGYIDYLEHAPPYGLLWVLLGEPMFDFNPPYGQIVHLSN